MDSLITYICDHAQHAHLMIFALIMLAGLSIPISEDILVLAAGAIAATCDTQHPLYMYAWVFAACWISAWEAYWIGRYFGPKLFEIPWFRHIMSPKRLAWLEFTYERFGIFTFIIGRFIPGGVRNALFMTSGLINMPFPLFIFRDGIGCLISSATIFYLGFAFGENYRVVLDYFHTYQEVFIGIVLVIILIGSIFFWVHRKHMNEE